MSSLGDDFKKLFPKLYFSLNDTQVKAVNTCVNTGNTLCIMPTGGGKSIVYWLAGLKLGGMTVVVSPLTALIVEQAEKIREHGYQVLEVHSGISSSVYIKTLKSLATKEYSPNFIFLSPEKLATDGYLEYCLKSRKNDISLFVIDEVHCVSQWGLDFRPFYKRIPDFLNELYGAGNWCRVLALTATLNPKELCDICQHFAIDKNNIVKSSFISRTEIQIHIKKLSNEDEKEEELWKILHRHREEKILVYVYRKYAERGVEDLCSKALKMGYVANYFHGDMSYKERKEIIDRYKSGESNIIFATNAFGMGIDIPDIDVVIHFMIPLSAEQYYQEIGRSARNGKSANSYLLYTDKNIEVNRDYYIKKSFPSEEILQNVFKKYFKKIGLVTLNLFDDEDKQLCLPYYIDQGLVEIVCKGFSKFNNILMSSDKQLEEYYNSTKNHSFCSTVKKLNIDPKTLCEQVYRGIAENKIAFKGTLSRDLIINVEAIIDQQTIARILTSEKQLKEYKNGLLDFFLYIIENNKDSNSIHQEISYYLGMSKYNLNRIYQTIDGNKVRSKSEVIICNLLHNEQLDYRYEQPLFYDEGKYILPDFTISTPSGKTIFWEHLGLLGNEQYDSDWDVKDKIFEKYFPDQLRKTYESTNISMCAQQLIQEIKKM